MLPKLPITPLLDGDVAERHSRSHSLLASGSLERTGQTSRPNSRLEHSPKSKVKKLWALPVVQSGSVYNSRE